MAVRLTNGRQTTAIASLLLLDDQRLLPAPSRLLVQQLLLDNLRLFQRLPENIEIDLTKFVVTPFFLNDDTNRITACWTCSIAAKKLLIISGNFTYSFPLNK